MEEGPDKTGTNSENGLPVVIMAEALLALLQTLASSILIFSAYHSRLSSRLLGRFRRVLLFEVAVYSVSLFEVSGA